MLRRVWTAPLWAHVLVLGVALLAFMPLIGTSSSFSPDEAVAITQARSLASGGGWIVEHPFAAIDPDDEFYPLAGSNQGQDGMAPFAKHPVYPLVLTALEPLGGVTAMVVLSVLATVAAAALAALLAKEVTGGLERPVLWAVGVGSPLLLDAYLVIAHSLGTALVAGATLAVVIAARRQRSVLPMVVAIALVGPAVLMRSEALLYAVALGVGASAAGIARRRLGLAAGGILLGVAGVATALFEKWLLELFIEASPQTITVPVAGGGFLEARWAGFVSTWVSPTSSSNVSGGDALLVLVLFIAVAAVAVLRWRPGRPHMLAFLGSSAAGLTVAALISDPDRVVPGLLVAFPLTVFALGLVDRDYFRTSGRLVLTVTVALFMAGVLATQYGAGGGAEWGGRYFALAVPVVAVLGIDALVRRGRTLPVPVQRRAGGALVACSLLLAIGAVTSITSVHRYNEDLTARLARSTQSVLPGDGGAPVVVSSWANIARLAWPTTSPQRWLYNPDEDRGAELASRLVGAGITELTFIGQDQEDIAPYLDHYAVDPRRSYAFGRWELSVLVSRGLEPPRVGVASDDGTPTPEHTFGRSEGR
jgi:hypothetical protein